MCCLKCCRSSWLQLRIAMVAALPAPEFIELWGELDGDKSRPDLRPKVLGRAVKVLKLGQQTSRCHLRILREKYRWSSWDPERSCYHEVWEPEWEPRPLQPFEDAARVDQTSWQRREDQICALRVTCADRKAEVRSYKHECADFVGPGIRYETLSTGARVLDTEDYSFVPTFGIPEEFFLVAAPSADSWEPQGHRERRHDAFTAPLLGKEFADIDARIFVITEKSLWNKLVQDSAPATEEDPFKVRQGTVKSHSTSKFPRGALLRHLALFEEAEAEARMPRP